MRSSSPSSAGGYCRINCRRFLIATVQTIWPCSDLGNLRLIFCIAGCHKMREEREMNFVTRQQPSRFHTNCGIQLRRLVQGAVFHHDHSFSYVANVRDWVPVHQNQVRELAWCDGTKFAIETHNACSM